MPTYEELLAASRAAWLAFCEYVDDVKDTGWGDDSDRETKQARIAELWSDYLAARSALGGDY